MATLLMSQQPEKNDPRSFFFAGHGLLVLILLAGLAFRLLIAWSPVVVLVQKTVPDDAFYYFAITRNLWAGSGLSVDGVVPTNGFHPLWALVLAVPFGIVRSGDLPVHLGLTLAAILDVAAAWLVYQTARRVSGSYVAGLLAAGLYALNPLVVMESLNGLETALSVFCIALTCFVYLTRIAGQMRIRLGDWVIFGLVVGLMLLARTDSVLLAVVFGLYALWKGRHAIGESVGGLAVSALVAGLMLAPWLAWNWFIFGTIVQSSAVAAPGVFRRALFEPLTQGIPLAEVWRYGFWPVIYLSFLLAFRYAGLPWVALVAAVILKRLLGVSGIIKTSGPENGLASLPNTRPEGHRLLVLLLPVIGTVLPLLVHTFVRWYPRSWYYVPLAWSSALVVGVLLAGLGRELSRSRSGRLAARMGLAVLAGVMVLLGAKSWRLGFYPWQDHMLAGAHWIAASTPADAVVASFNSGLQAYYSRRTIVNLDGVVNWEAIRAAESRSLLGYALCRGATYLVDYQAYVFTQFAPYMEPGYEDCLSQIDSLSPEYPPYGRVAAYTIQPDCVPVWIPDGQGVSR